MPYVWQPNPVAVTHRGVDLYNVFKHDDADSGASSYWFAAVDHARYEDENTFDVRAFPGYAEMEAAGKTVHDVLKAAIDDLHARREQSFLFPFMPDGVIPEPADHRDGPGPLHKTVVVIWTRESPEDMELSALAREAEAGNAYCSASRTELLPRPTEDPDWDGTEFFHRP